MAANTSIILSEHFVEFAQGQIREGRYGSTSEVVRAGLRLLERREAENAVLRKMLVDGDTSGLALPFDAGDYVAKWMTLPLNVESE